MLKIIYFITIFLLPQFAFANIKVIRDSETANFLTKISKPIFIQAGLDQDSIDIHIVNDASLNAFVAGGRNLFINSGLIIQADSIEALIGVIAHETGHLAGGHLIKLNSEVENMNTSLALGYILGIATAVSGNPDIGQALLLGSSHIAERSILKFSRNHEEASDEAALKYLYNLNIDPNGMLDFFDQIKIGENFSGSGELYTRSHPLTNDRILRIRSRITKYGDITYDDYSKANQVEFKFVKLKLECFLVDDPEVLILKYQGNSKYDKYARAILLHRMGNLEKALLNLNSLLSEDKENQYLIELKAQFYYESGEAKQALANYQIASKMDPKDVLLKIQIAESIISLEDPSLYPVAIEELDEALLQEYNNVVAWKRLSLLYEYLDKSNLSNLALAEAKYYSGSYRESLKLAELVLDEFNKDKAKYSEQNISRAKEIIDFSEKRIKEKH
ncbi:MAG: M48 family metalloprotease [Rickettsiales bacterium]|jgi:predicted Zn-dependent protease|nr:M48 family metalloprotease [Rickettsiales bacterium]